MSVYQIVMTLILTPLMIAFVRYLYRNLYWDLTDFHVTEIWYEVNYKRGLPGFPRRLVYRQPKAEQPVKQHSADHRVSDLLWQLYPQADLIAVYPYHYKGIKSIPVRPEKPRVRTSA